jgi:hypothetical protein
MIDSDTAAGPEMAPDEPVGTTDSTSDSEVASTSHPWLRRWAVPLLLALVVGTICFLNHEHGVDWGDDFALYLRQAKALNLGNVGEVIRDNRFTVDNSGWHSFSPIAYPWGWPLLMAPVYLIFGLNYGAIKVLEVLAFGGFLVLFYDLVRRRTDTAAAVGLVLLVGLSPTYIGATDTVLSDLPYLFFVGLTLWWLDRCWRNGLLDCGTRSLVVLGALAAFTFNIRRDGMMLLAAMAGLHLVVLAARARRERSLQALKTLPWKRLLLPYEVFAVAAVGFQLLLPTEIAQSPPNSGLGQVSSNFVYYRDTVAASVGLKATGQPMSLLHSQLLARDVMAVFGAFAVVGLVTRLIRRYQDDVPLAVYLIGMVGLVLVWPFQEGRYLDTITPLLAYFAFQAVPSVSALVRNRPRGSPPNVAMFVATVCLAGLVFLNVKITAHSTNYHLKYPQTAFGPVTPAAQEMFTAVDNDTRGDDIILFFRARAMTFYTDRVALQGLNLGQMLPRVDWYVMEKGSTYSQTLLTDQEAAGYGLTKVWQNSDWVLWRVAPGVS